MYKLAHQTDDWAQSDHRGLSQPTVPDLVVERSETLYWIEIETQSASVCRDTADSTGSSTEED